MAWKAHIDGRTVDDPKGDCKNAERYEQYRLSESAVYFPREKYLLLSDIRRVWIQPSMMNVVGSCGKGLPVSAVCLDYDTKDIVKLTMEKKQNAAAFVESLLRKNPEIEKIEWAKGYRAPAFTRGEG